MRKKIKIAGTGCALADFVYDNIDFHGPIFQKYLSKKEGDGGLSIGKLVFTEELERFTGKNYTDIISTISGGKKAATFNIGGPSLVSLIHAAQMLENEHFEVDFYGVSGKDETSERIREMLSQTPIDYSNYLDKSDKPTPFTHVLSDPNFDNGNGERTFINNIGAAWDLNPDELPESFFSSNIVCFGGTALTPKIGDELHHLLEKAKNTGATTVVNTVYNFRSEKENPGKPWPLGNSSQSFPHIDLLIMDNEEARRISGYHNVADAASYFMQQISAFIITSGPEKTLYFSNGNLFCKEQDELPISEMVSNKIKNGEYKGDTTGCGDNFVGGVISSVASQMKENSKKYKLKQAVLSGICSGGFACSYAGGTYFEKKPGEKKHKIEMLKKAYQNQL